MNLELSYFLEKRQLNIQVKEYEDVSEELLDDINDFCAMYKGVPISLWGQRLVELLDSFNLSSFTIYFEGSSNDYLELKEIVSKYNRFYEKEIKVLSLNGYRKELSLKFEKMREFIRQLQEMNFEENINDILEEVKRLNVLEVVVIATMSSGKSTLINSFLGKSLMPAQNEATTATVTKIYQANQGFYEVRALDQNDNVLTDWKVATLEKVQQCNEDLNVYTIELRGPLQLHSSENIDIVLVDTPGPNNSQDVSHRKATFEYIKSKEMPFILYVLNATQLGIEDDAALLQVLQREKTISNEQMVFVLNKIDALDPEKESIEHVMKNAKRYLIKNGIENPRVFPVTAKFAQLLRMNANSEEMSRRDERILRNHEYLEEDYNLVNYAMLSKEERKEIIQDIEKLRESGDKIGVSLYYTGVPLLEKKITNYIETFGTSYLLSKVQQKILKLIEEELHKITDIKKMIENLE